MRKILTILLSGIMCLSLVACGGEFHKEVESNIVIDFNEFQEQNKDESIVHDIEISTPEKSEEEDQTQNEEQVSNTTSFEEFYEIGEGLSSKNDKFEMVLYDDEILHLKSDYKRAVNGVSNMNMTIESDYLNIRATSWASTKKSTNGFVELSYEEALKIREDYSDIINCVSQGWVEEHITPDKLFLLVNSTTFNKLHSAFPDIKYDGEKNIAYLIFEPEFEHWYAGSFSDDVENKIVEESNSTSTLLIFDKDEVEKLDKIYIVTPEQFMDEWSIKEKEIEIAWGVSNEDELIQEDNNGISYMLFKSNVEFPQGILEVSTDEARDFIDTYLDKGNEAQINIEMFINSNKIFIINDRHASDATELETNLRALERAGRLYIEMYSDHEANDDGRNVIIVGLNPELYEKYENFSFVIDD